MKAELLSSPVLPEGGKLWCTPKLYIYQQMLSRLLIVNFGLLKIWKLKQKLRLFSWAHEKELVFYEEENFKDKG